MSFSIIRIRSYENRQDSYWGEKVRGAFEKSSLRKTQNVVEKVTEKFPGFFHSANVVNIH